VVCHPAPRVLADSVPYTGHTIEGRRIVIDVAARRVARLRVGIRHYRCETFGELGPVVITRVVDVPIGRDGRFRLSAGPPAERLTVSGRRRGRAITGTVRLRGTIATGQRCASATLRFRAGAPPVRGRR